MKSIVPLPPQKYLRECFLYDGASGTLRWKQRPIKHFANLQAWSYWNKRYAGTEAFTHVDQKGHKRGSLDGRVYFAHRIIWKLQKGRDPKGLVDHKNNKPGNNRWLNLRDASNSQNCMNHKLSARNTSGHTGVVFHRRTSRWHALINVANRRVHLGTFVEKAAAVEARSAAALRLHGEFAPQ